MRGHPTDGEGAWPKPAPESLRSKDRGGVDTGSRHAPVPDATDEALICVRAQNDAPGSAAPRARWPNGRLRRLVDAGAVPDGHPQGACPGPRARRALRRLAHGPGGDPGAGRCCRHRAAWCPADIQSLATGRARYTQLTNEAGGIIDDLIVTASRGRPVRRRQCRRPRGRPRALCRRTCRATTCVSSPIERSSRCRARKRSGVLAGWRPRSPSWRFMESRRAAAFPASPCASQGSATPARTASRSPSSRDHARQAGPHAARRPRPWRRPAWVPAIRSGSRRACASTATTSTRRRARSRPALAWTIGKRRREEGGFPGRRAHPGSSCRTAPTRRLVGHSARGPRAGARRGRHPGYGRQQGRLVTSGGFGPTVGGPIAMGYVASAAGQARHGTRQLEVRGKPRAGRGQPSCPSSPTATIAEGDRRWPRYFTKDHEWVDVARRHRHGRHHRPRPGAARRRRLRRAARGRPRR